MVRFRFPARFVAMLIASLALFGALSTSALADPGGNSAASAACEEGGYVNWTDANGNAFKNAGQCVSYAAHGGQLVPVAVEPVESLSVSVSALDGSPHACWVTVSVSGFDAGSVLFPTFLDWWNINGELQQIGLEPWVSPQSIPLDASGSGSLNFISANNQVTAEGYFVVTRITVDDLSWGPSQISC